MDYDNGPPPDFFTKVHEVCLLKSWSYNRTWVFKHTGKWIKICQYNSLTDPELPHILVVDITAENIHAVAWWCSAMNNGGMHTYIDPYDLHEDILTIYKSVFKFSDGSFAVRKRSETKLDTEWALTGANPDEMEEK